MQAKSSIDARIVENTPETDHPQDEWRTADTDPQETVEWIEAWDQILNEGPDRAAYLLRPIGRKLATIRTVESLARVGRRIGVD